MSDLDALKARASHARGFTVKVRPADVLSLIAQRDRAVAALREIAGAHIALEAYQLRSQARDALAELGES